MMIKTAREPQGGDIVCREKDNGSGLHFGRLVETADVFPQDVIDAWNLPDFLVPHTTPDQGKHLDTLEGFFGGLPGSWIPQEFPEPVRVNVELASVSDVGKPYTPLATCEDDVFGFSPTRNRIVEGVASLLLVFLGCAVVANFQT